MVPLPVLFRKNPSKELMGCLCIKCREVITVQAFRLAQKNRGRVTDTAVNDLRHHVCQDCKGKLVLKLKQLGLAPAGLPDDASVPA